MTFVTDESGVVLVRSAIVKRCVDSLLDENYIGMFRIFSASDSLPCFSYLLFLISSAAASPTFSSLLFPSAYLTLLSLLLLLLLPIPSVLVLLLLLPCFLFCFCCFFFFFSSHPSTSTSAFLLSSLPIRFYASSR